MPGESQAKLIRDLQVGVGTLDERISALRNEFGQFGLPELREKVSQIGERLAVIEDRVTELKRLKEEGERRHWQFLYIAAGAISMLLFNVIVQLLLALVRKP